MSRDSEPGSKRSCGMGADCGCAPSGWNVGRFQWPEAGKGGTSDHDAARATDTFVERNGLDESEYARELVPAIKLEKSAAGYR